MDAYYFGLTTTIVMNTGVLKDAVIRFLNVAARALNKARGDVNRADERLGEMKLRLCELTTTKDAFGKFQFKACQVKGCRRRQRARRRQRTSTIIGSVRSDETVSRTCCTSPNIGK